MKCRIIQAPDPHLRVIAQSITTHGEHFNEHYKTVVADLEDTFKDTENCIGLAATQLGHPWRVIIVDVSRRRTETYVMVNPVITKMSDDLQTVRDGCMSINNGQTHRDTKRPKRIVVEWVDPETWMSRRQKFTGLIAAAIHHEIDHLDGVLFTDRIAAAISKGELK